MPEKTRGGGAADDSGYYLPSPIIESLDLIKDQQQQQQEASTTSVTTTTTTQMVMMMQLQLQQQEQMSTNRSLESEASSSAGPGGRPQDDDEVQPATETTATTTTSPALSGRIPVMYEKRNGFLAISSEYLWFCSSSCNDNEQGGLSFHVEQQEVIRNWEWRKLDRVTAKIVMRITHWDPTIKALFFQFENRKVMKEATVEFRKRIRKARVDHAQNLLLHSSSHRSSSGGGNITTTTTSSAVSSIGQDDPAALRMNPQELEKLVNGLVEKKWLEKQQQQQQAEAEAQGEEQGEKMIELVNLNDSNTNSTPASGNNNKTSDRSNSGQGEEEMANDMMMMMQSSGIHTAQTESTTMTASSLSTGLPQSRDELESLVLALMATNNNNNNNRNNNPQHTIKGSFVDESMTDRDASARSEQPQRLQSIEERKKLLPQSSRYIQQSERQLNPKQSQLARSRRGGGGIISLAASRVGSLPPLPAPPIQASKHFDEMDETDYDFEDDWHSPFGESTYTLLYMHDKTTQAFWYALFIYSLQMLSIVLTMIDVIDENASTNPLRIPPMVPMSVSVSQGIAIFMAQALQSDLIEAVMKLQDGFYPEVLTFHPGATYPTWLFSCLAQLLSGMLLLAISFILTMQGETVVDLMLNMTALLFMAEIDDVGFAMAKMGFIKKQLQKEAQAVVDFRVPKRQSRNLERKVLYVIVLVGMFAGYGILKHRQLTGYYLQTNIYVQFGDAYNPKLPYYSGTLSSGDVKTPLYREYRDSTNQVLLAYCEADRAWTFSEDNDPCIYFARSAETRNHDVTTIPDWEWSVKGNDERFHPFETFSLVGRDCHRESDVCGGQCVDKICICPHDRFGHDCEFKINVDVCPGLIVDSNWWPFGTFLEQNSAGFNEFEFAVSTEFDLLKNNASEYVKVYDMPVYYSNRTYPSNIIFFGGRRWIVTSEWDLFNLTKAELENPGRHSFPEKTVATLEGGFHGYYQAQYTPLFISQPVDYETPSFLPTPAGLTWYQVVGDVEDRLYRPDLFTWTRLSCKSPTCLGQPSGFCGHGECDDISGICKCSHTYKGERCETEEACFEQSSPCNDHGVCDESEGWCRCELPHFGKFCQHYYKCYEENGRCRNGGVCDRVTGKCQCPPSTFGFSCEQTADCLTFGCENGGFCVPLTGQCVCREPFYGPLCDQVNTAKKELFCSADKDCKNGSCNLETGVCACEDPSRYGTLCEHHFSCSKADNTLSYASSLVPTCLNGGSCNASTSICDCPEPYFGPDCSQVQRCESDDDCGEGRLDVCDLESGSCRCNLGRTSGKLCEVDYFESSLCSVDEDCYHGKCSDSNSCECADDYGGPRCAFVHIEDDPQNHKYHTYEFVQELNEKRVNCCGFDDPLCHNKDEAECNDD